MAKSTGIVLAASGIAFANEWIVNDDINLRIPIAGAASSVIFAGIETLNKRAAVGLAYIMMITVLVTPLNGRTPLESVSDFITGNPNLAPRGKTNPKNPRQRTD